MNESEKNIRRVYLDTMLRFREELNGEDEQYWQGRKDGVRSIMVVMENAPIDVSLTIETSPGYVPLERELLHGLLEGAVYNIAAIVYELNTDSVDSRTVRNLEKFVNQYDYLANNGRVPIIDDHC